MKQSVSIKKSAIAAFVACAVLTVWGGSAFAHHSGAMFDDSREVMLTGVVQEFQYTNPHSWLIVDIANEDGTVTTWGFEAEGPSTLMRNGVRKSDLDAGTRVTVTANPMEDGRPAGQWSTIVRLEDDKLFCARGCAPDQSSQ